MERRFTRTDAATLEGNRLSGHASVFMEQTRIRDFVERIAPCAFDRALRERHDVVLLANHDGLPLGTTYAGTLRLATDERGLRIDSDLPDTSLGRDVRELARRGDLRSMSFGFQVTDEDWSKRDDGTPLRTIKDVTLFDVSVVTFPAYAGTDVALRAMNPPHGPHATDRPRVTARGQAALIRARIKA